MTDAEHAAVLRRLVAYDWHETDKAAIERAIELLEHEAKYAALRDKYRRWGEIHHKVEDEIDG